MSVKVVFHVYFFKWYVPAAVWLMLFVFWFLESRLALGPGWDNWWLLAWFLNALVYFITALRRQGREGFHFFGGVILCGIVQFGGCRVYDYYVPPVEEHKKCHFEECDRIRLGRYSDCIPMGAKNISFSYYDGMFSSRQVQCEVTEDDFLWFCWRNGYKVRRGTMPINERTGKVMKDTWFAIDLSRIQDYYSYYDIAETCAGRKILYDTVTQKLDYNWSTN